MKIDYPGWYPELSDEHLKVIEKHCDKYGIDAEVCAYYEDWEDFKSDWCDYIGLTEEEAESRLKEDTGEFLIFKGWGILRFVL